MPAMSPALASVFLVLWIGVICAVLFLLGLIGHGVEALLRWRERRDAKRPIARDAHFPRPVLLDGENG